MRSHMCCWSCGMPMTRRPGSCQLRWQLLLSNSQRIRWTSAGVASCFPAAYCSLVLRTHPVVKWCCSLPHEDYARACSDIDTAHLSLQISKALSRKEGAWPVRVGGPPAPSKGHLLVLLTEGGVRLVPTALCCRTPAMRRRRCRPSCRPDGREAWRDIDHGQDR